MKMSNALLMMGLLGADDETLGYLGGRKRNLFQRLEDRTETQRQIRADRMPTRIHTEEERQAAKEHRVNRERERRNLRKK